MGRLDLERYACLVEAAPEGRWVGHVTRIVGLTLECRGIHAALGELCSIVDPRKGEEILSEVVGFREESTILMPIEDTAMLSPGASVRPLGRRLSVSCGDFMLGRVLDALGRPIDGGAALPRGELLDIFRPAPGPLDRVPIDEPLETGMSVLDGLLTFGKGQRMGIFAGSGVGKSTLLGGIARSSTADVNVIALIGERGREVQEFIQKSLGPEGLRRSVIVVATSDCTPLLRFKGAFTAVTIAEWFRDQGADVMFMADSITRLANSVREIGLASGEPPTVKGYPPSFFGTMPKLVERLGRTGAGSITGILTVLVDADDMNEPVADTMRGLLDGHCVLSRRLAARGQFPAVDVLESASRVMDSVCSKDQLAAARQCKELLAVYEEARDLISVGAYREGSDPEIDRAIRAHGAMMRLLKQDHLERRSLEETRNLMAAVASDAEGGAS